MSKAALLAALVFYTCDGQRELGGQLRLLRILWNYGRLGFGASRAVNGVADTLIGAAAADVAAHGCVNVSVGGIRFLGE